MMPITILESMLHNTTDVTMEELVNFWVEGHKAAEEVSKIVEESKRESSEVGLQKDKGMERLPKEDNRGEGTELPKLREEDKSSPTSPRRQQRRKLSKPKS